MAPKVCVPADFGRHHIGAPSHGNLTFNLAEGVQIKANSIILSLNSPVIDDLLTDLHLTSLEAEDFSREAVDCFIEASYTGEIEAVTVGNFRDVNKMSRVFDVSWLVARCEEYFVSYLDKLDSESSYPDILFAVEEADYLLSTVKKRDFLNLVVKKMSILSAVKKDSFMKEYLSDLANSSQFMVDACVEIAKRDVDVLVTLLLAHLKENGNRSLDEMGRYLLRNIDMQYCFKKKPDLHTKLLEVLENLTDVTKEDLKLFLTFYKQKSNSFEESLPKRCLVPVARYGPFVDSLLKFARFHESFDKLKGREDIGDLYTFVEGLWCILGYTGTSMSSYEHEAIVDKIITVKEERCWGKINKMYVDRMLTEEYRTNYFVLALRNRNVHNLVSSSQDSSMGTVFEYTGADFVNEIFRKNNAFPFQIPGEKFADLKVGIFTTAAMNDNDDAAQFDMQWGFFDSAANSSLKVLPNLHFVLERSKNNFFNHTIAWEILPLSWCNKPTCDKSGKYWNWGYIKFHEHPDSTRPSTMKELVGEADGYVDWRHYVTISETDKVRLTFFVIE